MKHRSLPFLSNRFLFGDSCGEWQLRQSPSATGWCFTFIGVTLVIEIIADVLYRWSARPRPYDVTIIGRWDGWSFFAAPVAVVALVLMCGGSGFAWVIGREGLERLRKVEIWRLEKTFRRPTIPRKRLLWTTRRRR